MSDFDDFVANNRPTGKSPKLDRFRDDILGLKDLGYSENDILRYLNEKKSVIVSRKTLNLFINRNKKADVGRMGVQTESVSQSIGSSQSEPVRAVTVSAPRERAVFDWQKKIDPSELK